MRVFDADANPGAGLSSGTTTGVELGSVSVSLVFVVVMTTPSRLFSASPKKFLSDKWGVWIAVGVSSRVSALELILAIRGYQMSQEGLE